MRFFAFKFKYRSTDVSALAPAPVIERSLFSAEDTALLNYNAMYLNALTRERRSVDQH
jgi:hypothetical protein